MERAESKRAAKVRRGVRAVFRWHRVKEQKKPKTQSSQTDEEEDGRREREDEG